ncbi:dicarboxylate/amino acid:cation symporter [Azohydromonas caseinilytica]|uniref:Dicarboxylate/amino acid:cation symporter n=1 Tax=Azohydromonas caseinilytica TaxID=2728836 RepID=A0A848FGZ3_9BURK|nr:dicarboxylate/amino acid:cation symporter [Azohydromonas caseinilytica]NML18738.1 dicarboxylate/amino acid:cation symporter [Azohydromonas caseinilytica]
MKNMNPLVRQILVAMVLGVAVGWACHAAAADAAAAKDIARYFGIVTDVFLRMIKMVVAPLVFATLVAGVASMGDAKMVGRVGTKALTWFVTASLVSLGLGLVFVNLFQPGAALGLPLPDAHATTNLKTSALNLADFVTQVFPTSIAQAMASNAILQILVFSLFFGFAIAALPREATGTTVRFVDELVTIMLKLTDFVMRFAPLGVFAAIASVITTQGLGVLWTYGKFIGGFYAALAVLWLVMIVAGALVLGPGPMRRLLGLMREPLLIAFSTASSESAYPKMLEQLKTFGVRQRIASFVLPLGYSFNLDGSMMYQAFAALFVAQAFGVEMSLPTQVTMLLVLMVSSKGIAGVPRASLVVVAAVLPMFGLPEAGLLLIMGIDQFLDMGRTATNVIGNGIATAIVAKWEGQPTTAEDEEDEAQEAAAPARAQPQPG